MSTNTTTPVDELLERSRRLGADPRITNYGGGNTSAKGTEIDPASGEPIGLIWVKGSGGDLATLSRDGLAVLRRDRVLGLRAVYRGHEHEDEMVTAFEYCMHGKSGTAPSIDTSMHALVDAPHVDHLHPDAGIAIATAADGPELTRAIYGNRVVWVPWRRPGFQLGLEIAAIKAENPQAIGCILGGHGISAWGETSAECEANSLEIIDTAERYIAEHGRAEPFGPLVPSMAPLEVEARRRRAAELLPALRAIASADAPTIGHYIDDERVLDFMSRAEHARLADLGTSCPDHFLRTKVKPLVLDLAPDAPLEDVLTRLSDLHARYREEYRAYYERNADAASPAMRGADPAIILVPGIGMFGFGRDKLTARVAGEYFLNAINAMRGAEMLSSYAPIPEAEKFRIEYWALEEAKLQRMPKPKRHATRIALVTGAGSGIGKAIAQRLAAEGACVVLADVNAAGAEAVAQEIAEATGAIHPADVAVALQSDVRDEESVRDLLREAVLAFGGVDLIVNNAGLTVAKSLTDTTVQDWDLLHDVMARGSFLVSREAARVMVPQGMGGDVIYIASKNSIFPGPNNIAYSAAKADQAHQVRLLAAELGPHGIRVNGINPDGVVRGSGIFSGGWGTSRAASYGVPEEELGAYYAKRTLLGKEVIPEDVAAAVAVLASADLGQTTGLHVPVDSGVAAAFLR